MESVSGKRNFNFCQIFWGIDTEVECDVGGNAGNGDNDDDDDDDDDDLVTSICVSALSLPPPHPPPPPPLFGLSLLSLLFNQGVMYRTEITEATKYPLRLGFISGIYSIEMKYACLALETNFVSEFF